MRAIILAAGRGLRLQQTDDRQLPKCLLQFGGMSLLERHLRLLRNAGVDDIVLALGYRHERVEAELDRLRWQPRPEIVLNPGGDEPVKLCLSGGVPVELRKQLAEDLKYDTIGESVGFFRFDHAGARRLAELTAGYVARDCGHLPHEEAVRDLLREGRQTFEVADVTGAPWIEIDFPTDVVRAAHEVLPQLQPLPA